jgi:CHAT domain-containing protein
MVVKAEKWTVQVHGEMTVMNKAELAELNEVYRGSLLAGDERIQQRNSKLLERKKRNRTISSENKKTIENTEVAPSWVDNIASEFRSSVSVLENTIREESPEKEIEEERPEMVRMSTKGKY